MFTGIRHKRQSQRKSEGKQNKIKFMHKERSKLINAPQISTVLVTSTLLAAFFRTPCLGVASLLACVEMESTSRSKMLLMTKMTPRKGTATLEHQVHSTFIVQSKSKSQKPPQK